MYTEDDLRAVFGDLERDAPDVPGTLAGLDRLRRRRTLRHTALGMAAAVVTTVAVTTTAIVMTNPTDNAPATAAPPVTPLHFAFAVDAIPGHTVAYLVRDATEQGALVTLADPSKGTRGHVTVYAAGAFDASDARIGEPVEVNGRPGYFRPDRPCECEPGTELPTIVWEYADNAWATVIDMQRENVVPPNEARANLSRIAEALRFDRTTPIRIPFRVGYLPTGWYPSAVSMIFDLHGVNRSIRLSSSTGGDVTIDAGQVGDMPPVGQARVRPVPTDPPLPPGIPRQLEGAVDFRTFGVRLTGIGLTEGELLRIVRSITPAAGYDDLTTWFDADEAIPGG